MQVIFFGVIIPAALAWCAYLAFDTVRICRKADAPRRKLGSFSVGLGSDSVSAQSGRDKATLKDPNRPYPLSLADAVEVRS